MLRASARELGVEVDLRALVDGNRSLGLDGGRPLVTLGRAVAGGHDPVAAFDEVRDAFGRPAAVDAAAVAANFEIMNRVVDATGLPFGRRRADEMADVRAALDADAMPHAET